MSCPCCSAQPYQSCCEPFHLAKSFPSTPEQLMRSRFSAYALSLFDYVVKTYAKEQRQSLTRDDIQASNQDIKWLKLHVLHSNEVQVEFEAYYQIDKNFYCMHELSTFIQEAQKWVYTTGQMLAGTGEVKLSRNDVCLCGSEKKFKKCCGR